MNRYTLLYYPNFHPDPVWLRKILLLADNITRIVPDEALRDLDDPDELLRLQDTIPGCLSTISPDKDDVSIESDNLPRLKKAFALLAKAQGKGANKKVEILIDQNGSLSIGAHVFLHNAKVSPVIYEELRRNALLLSGFENLGRQPSSQDFIVVEESASDLILSAIAEKISRRKGLDAITDKPIPFVVKALNDLGHIQTGGSDGLEGLILSSLASVLIPTEVDSLKPTEYREIRESYAPIRNAFKELTAELARTNRLHSIRDPQGLNDAVQETARQFVREYDAFLKSAYARRFQQWTPLYVDGLLSSAAAIIPHPHIKIVMSGISFVFKVVHKRVCESTDQHPRARVFNMLAGVEKDIIRRIGIKKFF